MSAPDVVLVFEGFRLDKRRRTLTALDGTLIELKPRAFDTLLALAAHAGEIVTKQELLDTVWPNVVVEENNLNQVISSLRKAFGTDGKRLVITVPGRGYQLAADIREFPASAEPSTAEGARSAVADPPISTAAVAGEALPGIAAGSDGTGIDGGRSGRSKPAWFRQPAILGGIGLAVLAVLAISIGALRPTANEVVSQRIAFFGFAAASDDELAGDIAAATTNETFEALLALRLEAVSRAETQGVQLAQQRARAAELGATYALGGEVRAAAGVVRIQMHLEDVATRTTLWEQSLSGGVADKVSLPVLAAGAATRVARCLTGARPTLASHEGDILAQLATACATPFVAYYEALPQWRALAMRAPNSAVIQANLGNSLLYHANHQELSDAELAEVWAEAAATAERTLAIEPDNGVARTVLAYVAIYEGRPLVEAGELMDAATTVSPDDWRRGETASNRNEFLLGVGRTRASLVAAQATIDRDPLSPTPYFLLARALVYVGRAPEAGRIWEQMNARWPDAWWDIWAVYAVRDGISDIETVLDGAPPRVSEDTKACWRQISAASLSTDPAVRRAGAATARECGTDARISLYHAELMRAQLLDDVPGLVGGYGRFLIPNLPSNFLFNAGELFIETNSDLRADPAFLPLMKASGIYQYWLDSGTRPDTCDLPQEQDFEVCKSLRADQASH